MIVITGRMAVPDGNRDAFCRIATQQVELSRREAGCLNYWLFEDVHERGTFFFYEGWKDRAAVDFHFAQTYCLDFVRALRGLTDGKPDMHIRTIAEKSGEPHV
jgi:quinol monooxygenase YgiN